MELHGREVRQLLNSNRSAVAGLPVTLPLIGGAATRFGFLLAAGARFGSPLPFASFHGAQRSAGRSRRGSVTGL